VAHAESRANGRRARGTLRLCRLPGPRRRIDL